jgi:FkbM family methyltransferase
MPYAELMAQWFRRRFDDLARQSGRLPVAGVKLANAAHRFSLMGGGFSFDMSLNGERALIRQCAQLHTSSRPLVAFDVGAHYGEWSAYLDSVMQTGRRLDGYLFEPTPVTFAALQRNVRTLKGRFRLNEVALAECAGTAPFDTYDGAGSVNTLVSSSSVHDGYLETIEIQMAVGDEYCASSGISHIDLLKIDVEGAEMSVLQGFDSMLKGSAIGVIQFEYGYGSGDAGSLMKDFYAFFEDHGYLVGPLRWNGVRFQEFGYGMNNFESGPNYVAALPSIAAGLSSFTVSAQ